MVSVDRPRRQIRRAAARRARLFAWLTEHLGDDAPDIPETVPPIASPTRFLLAAYALLIIGPAGLFAWMHGTMAAWGIAAFVAATALAIAVVIGRRLDEAVNALVLAADVDAVTGARSRAWGERRLRRTLARIDFRERRIVALLDLDDFKRVNDNFGHVGGDRALRAVARILDDTLRANDWAARWGGDEFVVVIDARVDHALEALERLRLAIATQTFAGVPRGLTVSIGATLTRPGDEIEDVVDRADRALYAVKDAGGDGVQITTSDT